MKTNTLLKNIIEHQKETFEKGFGITNEIQENVEEKSLKTIEDAQYIPEQAREFIKQWIRAAKTGRTAVQNWVAKGFEEIEHNLAGTR